MITVDEKVLQQALEALESGLDVDPIFAGETITALRAALEQTVQEPVAWACFKNGELQTELVGTEADVDFWCASDEPEMEGMSRAPSTPTHPAASGEG
jgi:hypothetical protein